MDWILDAEDEEAERLLVGRFTLVIQFRHTYRSYKFDQFMHVGSTLRTEDMTTSVLNK